MTDIATDIARIRDEGLARLRTARTLDELDAARSAALGKRSELTAVQRSLGTMGTDQRRTVGAEVNAARALLTDAEAVRRAELEAERDRVTLAAERIDVTLPPRVPTRGGLHPVFETMERLTDILVGLGYRVAEGPEVETEWHNFDALNAPPDHPARSLQDTIYVERLDGTARPDGITGVLLRPQTSPMQIRTMLAEQPPIYVAIPGRVYRADTADATHLPMFHQVEGLAVDTDLSFADLKGSLVVAARALLGEGVRLRFRPHYFPFTEPSCELDAWNGDRWMEVLGAGMVHPNVLRAGGLDPEQFRGFAWGMGVDRMAMLRHGISDLRLLVENDLRFLASV
ncbi:MAG TPA: phenylalanine--tRNA ligase subunit alpha [Egibacteraceae bacterium]|nr:phenylalanine--tRNA ligase subunit alpha [Egibacteraceae bacterium]